jgi:L-fuculose-phosphate aldolase
LNSIQKIKQQLVEAGKRTYNRGYVAANDGNISARYGDKIIVTPTGVSKGFMKPEDMVTIDLNGNIRSGSKKPSSEVQMHLLVYRNRKDVYSVCHAHPPYATAFAVAGIPLDQCVLSEVIITLGKIPIVDYGTPGSREYFKSLKLLLPDHDAFLLANHGAMTIGPNIISAYHKMETLEHFAQISFIARQLGHTTTLSKEQVEKLTALRSKFGINTTAQCNLPEEGISVTTDIENSQKINVDEIVDKILKELK